MPSASEPQGSVTERKETRLDWLGRVWVPIIVALITVVLGSWLTWKLQQTMREEERQSAKARLTYFQISSVMSGDSSKIVMGYRIENTSEAQAQDVEVEVSASLPIRKDDLYRAYPRRATEVTMGSSTHALLRFAPLNPKADTALFVVMDRPQSQPDTKVEVLVSATCGNCLEKAEFGGTFTPPMVSFTEATPAPVPGCLIYTIRPGDTFASIAQSYDDTVYGLAYRNGIVNPNWLYAGQLIIVCNSGKN